MKSHPWMRFKSPLARVLSLCLAYLLLMAGAACRMPAPKEVIPTPLGKVFVTSTARQGGEELTSPNFPAETSEAFSVSPSPSLVEGVTPTRPPLWPTEVSTPTPSCQDDLRYIEDVTIPDGTVVSPGQELDKRWKIVNSGTCHWGQGYSLRRIAGPPMGAPDEQGLYPARAGLEVIIRMLLIAPTEPGTHRTAWQAFNPQGEAFGEPIFIEVVVSGAAP